MRGCRYHLIDLPMALGREKGDLSACLVQVLGGSPEDYREVALERLSLDARHKGRIRYLATLRFVSDQAFPDPTLPPGCRMVPAPESPDFTVTRLAHPPRVVVVGTGPAGLFCTLRLLAHGIQPIVLERGPRMDQRVMKVERLWNEGVLDPEANAQFGEGGAGTFSDGKLTTRTGNQFTKHVLDLFVQFGAKPEILYQAKPHIGTELIQACVVRMRQWAEGQGAIFRFDTALQDLRWSRGRISAALTRTGEEIPCDHLVLAPGHSARDTFNMLHRHGLNMERKPFAMGLRIEHPQELIDRAQYGDSAGHPSLGAADYKLVCNLGPDRAAYSFCMCPGGEVIQCASEPGGVVVNGMSGSQRDSGFANSGLVAKVNVQDFPTDHTLSGMHLQRTWEEAAFRAAGESYGAPAMSVEDFLKGRATGRIARQRFRPQAVPADLRRCLPDFVLDQLTEALPVFERKIRGFTSREAVLLGIESRTSSPVRIVRGENGQSLSHPGVFPCGEGAGYAGGITSAAADGIRIADLVAGSAPMVDVSALQ
ncbi:MAG: putative FAD-dependent dehydrogenase [Holophagaceae bacterium]|nr:putative FAD-dependent dehydrogenase [Holophagaceae bacterium]